jgi:hypothetical protein
VDRRKDRSGPAGAAGIFDGIRPAAAQTKPPHWERAQERLRKILGEERWEEVADLTHKVVRSAREA